MSCPRYDIQEWTVFLCFRTNRAGYSLLTVPRVEVLLNRGQKVCWLQALHSSCTAAFSGACGVPCCPRQTALPGLHGSQEDREDSSFFRGLRRFGDGDT